MAVLRQAVLEEGVQRFVRRVPRTEMLGDGLTKCAYNKVLLRVMGEGRWALADTEEAQKRRCLVAEREAQSRKTRRK